ncbi:hypothetical protein EJ04DRAFT_159750 [Polyplosphaeria fusca]|uniref:Uncharacterized protein n=1 Tax=Polyplosphaeria fusca TaxID=682080 RepID=A0A9P4QZF9_9PLEO|nr:hypothetical protein EJ04DRAFT_159750 [Polyplosphaeria fusca]
MTDRSLLMHERVFSFLRITTGVQVRDRRSARGDVWSGEGRRVQGRRSADGSAGRRRGRFCAGGFEGAGELRFLVDGCWSEEMVGRVGASLEGADGGCEGLRELVWSEGVVVVVVVTAAAGGVCLADFLSFFLLMAAGFVEIAVGRKRGRARRWGRRGFGECRDATREKKFRVERILGMR